MGLLQTVTINHDSLSDIQQMQLFSERQFIYGWSRIFIKPISPHCPLNLQTGSDMAETSF
jgi:hypothetical protein